MNRRKVLQLITAAGAAVVLLPSCDLSRVPRFKNFEIKRSQFKMLNELSNKILPIPEELVLENLTPAELILNLIDDCSSKEDIAKFQRGMQAHEAIEAEKSLEIISALLKEKDENGEAKDIAFFLQKMRSYSIEYYTGLEEYLSTYTDWEFMPGRFKGCVKV